MAKKKPYLTAAKLGILPEERTALIAFIEAPALGRIISVNGHAHFYDQGSVDIQSKAEENECGTAGCVAGYVFAHAKYVQGLKKVRDARSSDGYINAAWGLIAIKYDEYGDVLEEGRAVAPLLKALYEESGDMKLDSARKVVDHMLRKGEVDWDKGEYR